DVQQLSEMDGLFVLVTDVLALQSRGATIGTPLDHRVVNAGHVSRTTVRGATKLSDRDRLALRAPLRDEGADMLAVASSRRGCAIRRIRGNDVEPCPVHAF